MSLKSLRLTERKKKEKRKKKEAKTLGKQTQKRTVSDEDDEKIT